MQIYRKEDVFQKGLGLSVRRHRMKSDEAEHLHAFVEIVYIADGAGIHGIDGVEYRVRRGALLLINYRQVHYFKTEGEMELCNILLDPEWISEKLIEPDNAFELLTLSGFTQFQKEIDTGHPLVHFEGWKRARLEQLIRRMEEEDGGRESGYETVLKAQVNILLTMIFREMSVGGKTPAQFQMTLEFLQYIRAHCAEKLTLEGLARQCFYNPSYFSRLFKEHFGLTLTEFINRSRLERACRLLETTRLSAEEIAVQAGFGNRTVFYRLFREKTGLTPQQYRKVKNTDKET